MMSRASVNSTVPPLVLSGVEVSFISAAPFRIFPRNPDPEPEKARSAVPIAVSAGKGQNACSPCRNGDRSPRTCRGKAFNARGTRLAVANRVVIPKQTLRCVAALDQAVCCITRTTPAAPWKLRPRARRTTQVSDTLPEPERVATLPEKKAWNWKPSEHLSAKEKAAGSHPVAGLPGLSSSFFDIAGTV